MTFQATIDGDHDFKGGDAWIFPDELAACDPGATVEVIAGPPRAAGYYPVSGKPTGTRPGAALVRYWDAGAQAWRRSSDSDAATGGDVYRPIGPRITLDEEPLP